MELVLRDFVNLDEQQLFEPIKGLRAKLIHTQNQTIAIWQIDKGTILPEHSHVHEQIAIINSGKLELTIESETQILEKGMVAVIPSNAKHSAIAITDVELTDVFHPRREDFIEAMR